jgi:hypothetical protein
VGPKSKFNNNYSVLRRPYPVFWRETFHTHCYLLLCALSAFPASALRGRGVYPLHYFLVCDHSCCHCVCCRPNVEPANLLKTLAEQDTNTRRI